MWSWEDAAILALKGFDKLSFGGHNRNDLLSACVVKSTPHSLMEIVPNYAS